jgi:hypothetical protein
MVVSKIKLSAIESPDKSLRRGDTHSTTGIGSSTSFQNSYTKDGMLNIMAILMTRRKMLNRTVRVPENGHNRAEKWVFSCEKAEQKVLLARQLKAELDLAEGDSVGGEKSRPPSNDCTWWHLYGHDPHTMNIIATHFGFRDQDIEAANTPAMDGPQVRYHHLLHLFRIGNTPGRS